MVGPFGLELCCQTAWAVEALPAKVGLSRFRRVIAFHICVLPLVSGAKRPRRR
jgi:hypothetical protein